ncbi:MAG TPA: hypothetical protein VHS80_14945, partial [Chthoniobacterales bacterium]|nr:hypothetical protein [Chthoniobacterales bacterium]
SGLGVYSISRHRDSLFPRKTLALLKVEHIESAKSRYHCEGFQTNSGSKTVIFVVSGATNGQQNGSTLSRIVVDFAQLL